MNSAKVKPKNVSLHPKKSPNKPPDYCNIASLANYSILHILKLTIHESLKKSSYLEHCNTVTKIKTWI